MACLIACLPPDRTESPHGGQTVFLPPMRVDLRAPDSVFPVRLEQLELRPERDACVINRTKYHVRQARNECTPNPVRCHRRLDSCLSIVPSACTFRHSVMVASITPQARASLAERFGLSTAETHARLLTFLREREGIHHLVDSSLGADFSLLEAGEEFVRRWRHVENRAGPATGSGIGGSGGARPPLAAWAAPPPTVALSSTRRFNVELGREEINQMQGQEAVATGGVNGDGNDVGLVSGKRVRDGELPVVGLASSSSGGAGGDGAGGGSAGGVQGERGEGGGGPRPPRGPGELLVLTSACPGWVCYAEKTAPEALPFMSTVKSPQQVGAHEFLARAHTRTPFG